MQVLKRREEAAVFRRDLPVQRRGAQNDEVAGVAVREARGHVDRVGVRLCGIFRKVGRKRLRQERLARERHHADRAVQRNAAREVARQRDAQRGAVLRVMRPVFPHALQGVRVVPAEEDADRGERALRVVVKRLFVAVVIDEAPARGGVAVGVHPEQRAGAEELLAAVLVERRTDDFGLYGLPHQDVLLERDRFAGLRRAEVLGEDLFKVVAGVRVEAPLLGLRVELIRVAALFERLEVQRRDHAEFADEGGLGFRDAEEIAVELVEVVVGAPEMLVALADVVGAVAAPRAAQAERALRVVGRADGGQHFLVNLFAVERKRLFRVLDVALVHRVVFVVAAPADEAGVTALVLDLIHSLAADVLHELRVEVRVIAAGEHEVVPDEHAEAVAQVHEGVALVEAAAPDAEHVHVHVERAADQELVALCRDAADDLVHRHPVGALCKDGRAVQHEGEGLVAPAADRRLAQGKRADAVALDRRVEHGAGRVEQLELYGVEVGAAVAAAPPELRVFDREGELSVLGRRGHGGDGSLRLEGGVGRHGAAHGAGRVAEELHRAVYLHFGRAVRHAAVDVHVRKTRLIVAAQVHRLVDAAGRQPARPVPAVAELRLAQVAAVGLVPVPGKLHKVERLALGALSRDALVDAHRERVFAEMRG